MALLGAGAGLTIPSATESVMGSLPSRDTGVGSATNGAFLQLGGALGVAVIGSLLNTRYQGKMTSALAPYHIPHDVASAILGSLGGALTVAGQAGGVLGAELAQLARSAFVSGMDLGLAAGACVAAAGCLLALIVLPSRAAHDAEAAADDRGAGAGAGAEVTARPGTEQPAQSRWSPAFGTSGPGAGGGCGQR